MTEPRDVSGRPATDSVPRFGSRPVVTVAVALLVVPIALDLALSHTRRLFAYLAADAFYYLTVAREWAEHGRLSFDGRHPTNGFHPLWQLTEGVLWWIGQRLGIGAVGMLWVVVIAGVALLVAGLLLLARTLVLAHGSLTPWFALVPVGTYALAVLPAWLWVGALDPARRDPFEGSLPLYGTLWSYVNGMETPLVLLAFAAVAWWATDRTLATGGQGAVLGALLAALTLARHDSGAVAVAVLAALAVACRRDHDRLRALAAAALVLVAAIAVYLAWNRWYAGAALPVSGRLKTTFPRPGLGNWRDLWQLRTNHLFGPERLYRQGPVVVTAVAAGLWLARRGRTTLRGGAASPVARYGVLLTGAAAGALLIAAYNFFFVPGYNQGHWYEALPVLIVTLLTLEAIRTVAVSHAVTVLAAATVATAALFVTVGRRADYHRRFADFTLDAAPALRRRYGDHPPALVEYDDGIVAYATGFPAMSGTGFTLDRAGADAHHDGRLLRLAHERGYTRLASLVYVDMSGLRPSSPSAAVEARLRTLASNEHWDRYRYRVEYVTPPGGLASPWHGNDGRFVIIRFAPR
jgi:hypothetical protein